MSKEEVKVELEDDRIFQISGEKKREKEENGATLSGASGSSCVGSGFRRT